ncbi:CE1759 family FMN reductase [Nocardioides convexus]|uniref:CE1759 family FMN reductase n=1 Tax=Nocardioides convexus TaxID=2712224 RepID=UPI002418AFFD|nr:CE1759 family FMN reductase [Nocardioides convexus]
MQHAVTARGRDVDVRHVELRPLAHALSDHLLTGFPTGDLAPAIDAVRHADALVVVTPVFSASYSGLFKTFFDVLEPGTLDGKPVVIAATAGTARHSLVLDHALRPLLAYLRAVVVPTGVFAAAEDFGATDDGSLDKRVQRAAGEPGRPARRRNRSGAGASAQRRRRARGAHPVRAGLLREAGGDSVR